MGMSTAEKMRRTDVLLKQAGAIKDSAVMGTDLRLFFYHKISVTYFLDNELKTGKVWGLSFDINKEGNVGVFIETEDDPIAISCIQTIETPI